MVAVYHLIDKREKMNNENWSKYALENGISEPQLKTVVDLLENIELWKNSPSLLAIFELLKSYKLTDYIQFDPNIIRGLDYYTGIVFEAKDKEGGRAIFGGGRYNNLVGDVGGQSTGGLGFAMGDVVMRLVLEKFDKIPKFTKSPAEVLVTIFDVESESKSIEISTLVRAAGINSECYPEPSKLQKQFKYADRNGIRFILVAGPDEINNGQVTIKNLKDGSQITVLEENLIDKILELKK
jgi:histidyl-tRNA synthetase